MGEYFVKGNLSVYYTEVKTTYYYGLSIKITTLFLGIIVLFYNGENYDLKSAALMPKNNFIVFHSTLIILVYIFIFEVERGIENIYSVRITELYGYSPILFLIAYYSSGNQYRKKAILLFLIVIFIFQDFYYGGRITSLQLLILAATTILHKTLSFKRIMIFGTIGIFINSIVAAYRRTFNLENVSLINVFQDLKNNFFVFDTPVGAYYASATHIAASEVADINIRLMSFVEFFFSIFLGSSDIKSNVTALVKQDYFINGGGGLIPSHFYFWLGWSGVVLISIIVVMTFNSFTILNSDLAKLVLIAVTVKSPAWFLYSPTNLFRGSIFVVIILYYVVTIFHHFSVKSIGEKSKIKIH